MRALLAEDGSRAQETEPEAQGPRPVNAAGRAEGVVDGHVSPKDRPRFARNDETRATLIRL